MLRHSVQMTCTERVEEPGLAGGRLQNVRDIGGRGLRPGVLYRSDAPREGDAPPDLAPWPPRTVVDLRSEEEIGPRHPLTGPDTDIVWEELAVDASLAHMLEDEDTAPDDLGVLYLQMLRTTAPALVRIVRLIATRPPPVLVHCAAGKDRTGLAIAVALSAVGVPREQVVEDYARTQANMPGVLERISTDPRMPGGPDAIERVRVERPQLLDAPAAAMEAALDELDDADGAAEWLLRNGLSDAELSALRERLLVA